MKVGAIVPAAGVGKRLKAHLHKLFVPLAGRPILFWTLSILGKSPAIHEIVVAVHRSDIAATRRLVARARLPKAIRVVAGGATRTESVFNGLRALSKEIQWVIVHDAARPLVDLQVVASVVEAARVHGAAIAAVPVVPTVKQAQGGWVERTLDRNHLWAVQTPQVFRRDLLEKAHQRARASGVTATDDSALVEILGVKVRVVMGDSRNIKVTTPEDLIVAEALLENPP